MFFSLQLHTLVTDETGIQITELYQQEQSNGATGGSSATQHLRASAEISYQNKAESILSDENCYKAVIVSTQEAQSGDILVFCWS